MEEPIESYTHFSFVTLFKQAMKYAIEGGQVEIVEGFLDVVIAQVKVWLEEHPKNADYAKQVIKTILDYQFPQSDSRLKSLQARVNYLKGIISLRGFYCFWKNDNLSYKHLVLATNQGYTAAYAALGAWHLQKTFGSQENLKYNEDYHYAIEYYKKAGDEGKEGLVHAIHNYCHSQFSLGDFDAINQALKDMPQGEFEFHKKIEKFRMLERANKDAILIEAHYKRCSELKDFQQREQKYLLIKNQLTYKSHPFLDRCHGNLLQGILFDANLDIFNDEESKKHNELYDRRVKFFEKSQKFENYPDDMRAFVLHNQDESRKAMKTGCYFSYVDLARTALNREGVEESKSYYHKGINAGDPSAALEYIDYIQRDEISKARDEKDYQSVLKLYREQIDVLGKAKKHLGEENIKLYKLDDEIHKAEKCIAEIKEQHNIQEPKLSITAKNDNKTISFLFDNCSPSTMEKSVECSVPKSEEKHLIKQLCFFKLVKAHVQQHKVKLDNRVTSNWFLSDREKQIAEESARQCKIILHAEETGDWMSAAIALNLLLPGAFEMQNQCSK